MSTVSRGPYKNGIQTRREIIESASRIFGQFGYEGATLRQIAGDVGVSSTALVQHFGSKQGILIAVLEEWAIETRSQAPADRTGLGFFTALSSVMEYHTRHRGFIELFLTIATEASNSAHPAREFITNRYDKLIEDGVHELKRARDNGDVENFDDQELQHEVRLLFATMDGIEIQWLLNPEIDLVGTFNYHLQKTLDRWTAAR